MTTEQLDKKYIAGTYARFPVCIVRGEGAVLYDDAGKSYIDMMSGIGVNIFGACDKEWADAVSAQLHTLQHASNLFYTQPCARLAAKLCEASGMKKVFFANSGAEANECAIKTARKWAAENKGADHYTVATLKDGFHGRTLATLAATGQDGLHKDFLPLTQGFVYSTPGDAAELDAVLSGEKCAAVMLEIIQGEGGVRPLSAEFVKSVEELVAKHGVLLIVDEVQTGMGRTGKFYSYMHYGLHPDIVTSAKGLGGGLPVGATLFGERTADTLTAGSHGSTFGGNPAVVAGAENIVGRLTDSFLAEVAEKGNYVMNALKGAKGITEVTGMGLMIGATTARPVGDVLADLRAEGVLALKAHDRLRLLPPLTIGMDELEKAVGKIIEVCAK